MDKKANIKVKEYFDVHDIYTKKYGRGRTIVLIQIEHSIIVIIN